MEKPLWRKRPENAFLKKELAKMNKIKNQIKRKLKEAWKEIAEGKYREMDSKDFLKEISKW